MVQHLVRDPHKLKMYSDIIIKHEKRVFIERVTHPETTVGTCHYLPHHAVFKESATTPIRVVYECSCRQSREHPSLNDSLLPGPPITNDLTAILPWLPRHKYGFATDHWECLMNKTGMLHSSSAWVTSVTLTAPSKFTAPRLSPAIGHRQPTGPSAPFPGSPGSKKACQESDQSLRDLQDDYRTAVQHSWPISSSKEKTHSSEAVAEEKDYICFFTCATTRVVRLVVVTDFSIQTFVLA